MDAFRRRRQPRAVAAVLCVGLAGMADGSDAPTPAPTMLPTPAPSMLPEVFSVASLARYPGYAGALAVIGTVTLGDAGSGIVLGGTVAGLEASATGGIHVHTGVSCASADVVGGHYFDGMDADPWLTTTYASNAAGVAAVAVTVAGFSPEDVVGRAVVVHAGDGARVACGLLEAEAAPVDDVALGDDDAARDVFDRHDALTTAVAWIIFVVFGVTVVTGLVFCCGRLRPRRPADDTPANLRPMSALARKMTSVEMPERASIA